MKFTNRKHCGGFTLLEILMVVAIVGILAALTVPQARAQVTNGVFRQATNLPSVITAGASSNSLTSWLPLRSDRGAALNWNLKASAGVGNVAFHVTPAIDVARPSANIGWWVLGSANGTTTVNITTNLPRDMLVGYNYLNVDALTNQNNGTLTNGSFTLSQ
jgi:prepilin-type N-terminal cleavage/methylation domain-containing protein